MTLGSHSQPPKRQSKHQRVCAGHLGLEVPVGAHIGQESAAQMHKTGHQEYKLRDRQSKPPSPNVVVRKLVGVCIDVLGGFPVSLNHQNCTSFGALKPKDGDHADVPLR